MAVIADFVKALSVDILNCVVHLEEPVLCVEKCESTPHRKLSTGFKLQVSPISLNKQAENEVVTFLNEHLSVTSGAFRTL